MGQLLFITELILFFAAPLLQIILIVQRIKNRTKIPIGAATVLMLLTAIGFCIAATHLIIDPINKEPSDKIRCLTGPMSAAILMLFFNVTSVTLTGIIGYAIYDSKRSKLKHYATT